MVSHNNQGIIRMNKGELVEKIAEGADITKASAGGGDVALVGFGTYKVNDRAAITGRTPQTGAEIQIAAAKALAFKAGKALKDAVNV